MPLPGALQVPEEFRARQPVKSAPERLMTRIERERQFVRPDNVNDIQPRTPDWLEKSNPQIPIPVRDSPAQRRLIAQNRSVDSLGKSANEATTAKVLWDQQAAAARALAQNQALSERQMEIMSGIGSMGLIPGASGKRQQVINFGKQLLGQPYQWGGGHGNIRVGPVDCSGLVLYAFRKAGFKNVPGVSQSQSLWGKKTSISKLLPGDLVARGGSPGKATHIAIYLGNNMILEAQKSGTRVHIRSIKGQGGWYGVHLNY